MSKKRFLVKVEAWIEVEAVDLWDARLKAERMMEEGNVFGPVDWVATEAKEMELWP